MKLKTIPYFLSAVFLFMSINSFAQEKDKTRWTPEDIINTETMKSVSISPDGTKVVWTKTKAVKEKDKFVSDIYLTLLNVTDKKGFKTIQLTNAEENDFSPVFSKDGEFIYFLSSRDKGKKLWKLSVYGGEAQEVHEFKNGISTIQWKNKNAFLFSANEGETLRDKTFKEAKDDVEVIEDTIYWKPKRIFEFDIESKSIKRITNNTKPVGSFAVSPNGTWLIYSMDRSTSFDADATKDPFYYLQNLETGASKQILTDLKQPSDSFKFTPDGLGFYFKSTFSSNPEWNGEGVEELYFYSLEKNTHQKINLQWDLGIGRGFELLGNDVLVTLANKAYYKLSLYKKSKNGWDKTDLNLGEKNNSTTILSTSENGLKVVYQHSNSAKLPKFYISNVQKGKFTSEKELITLNENLAKKPLTNYEVFVWKGYKNEEVTGILYYPENYEKGKKYPLILSIHGGPAGADTDTWAERWSTYPNILAQRGAFVLQPNYHGSSNHGLAFVESIKGNYYEPEMDDIMKAISVLEEKGMIDVDKLGTMGWSNGAILTTMLTVKYPDMFKFAAAGAGDVNWTSDYGTCSFGVSFDQIYFGGAPWDDMNGTFYNENYILKSPLFEIEKIKTPTIIFHGSEDRAVPRDQGWEYYRGLQQVGKTPVRFLWFPGQPHGLGKISHQLRKMNEELDWIDTYLFEKPSKENVTFKKDSPLAQLLEIDKVAIDEQGNFGLLFQGKLIPETVLTKKDSISIGRFEITNAQYKSFKPDFQFNAGLDNYPVITSKENAINYVTWLSTLTKKTYRLPTAKEAEKLHKKAHKAAAKENTLNYWSGFDLTMDEVPLFLQKLKETQTLLFKKVGKSAKTTIGDADIYDLGGNVAEYFENGIYGYSAYDFYDPSNDKMIESKHVGIRIIKE
ncbi:prolyl oligopeptidase family serine peptidase [Lutibacter sp.]|uniref:prolyl oligopeptidase family serine peptidase n=1 Tax=Lutibacter sp. TaxID=1925666 RepID=UPI0027356A9D|nr:prolyl oligopeptidase family serine peptidase [Lutibacter sp.]MDP3312608.1 prolyl oligopeptidase family serine peptidase [Lutibacter sp.]